MSLAPTGFVPNEAPCGNTRRECLWQWGGGFAALPLVDLMTREAEAAGIGEAIVVNTCAVTGEAVRQARQAIRRARRENPGARIVVTGCAAQIDPETFAAMPAADQVPLEVNANLIVEFYR